MTKPENIYNKQNESFAHLLYSLNRAYTIYINREMSKYNVTKNEIEILSELSHHENKTQKELADYFELNESTITRTLVKLEKKGFIKRIENPNNKREKLVSITDKTKQNLDEINKLQKEFHDYLFEDFTEEEQDKLKNDFKKLVDLIYSKLLIN